MFTGIIEELGRFDTRRGHRFRFLADTILSDATLGDSIAVDGCCLTLVEQGPGWWEADVSQESLRCTALGALAPGDVVNLERPLRLTDRLGGHLVLGHVDAMGTLVACPPDMVVAVPAALGRYCVTKGSVAVDGVSLTIVSVAPRRHDPASVVLSFAVIPHTALVTTLGHKAAGNAVNIEVDVMAKHVERLMEPYRAGEPAGPVGDG